MSAILALTMVAGCARQTTTSPPPAPNAAAPTTDAAPAPAPENTGAVSQGVTDTEILIGCTFVNSGSMAFIGVPVLDTIKGVIERANANGGIRGRKIRLIHYDDQYDAAVGKTLLEKLVEEDKVFAINCLGGNNVASSLDYLKDYGIPVVNITGGLDASYEDYNPDSAVFVVQPSSGTDGPVMLSRALHESIFGPNKDEKLPEGTKIGVMYGNNEAGNDTLAGIKKQAEKEGVTDRLVIEAVTADTYAAAIQKMKNENVGVLLFGSIDSKGITAAMDDARWEVPFIGAYGTSTIQSFSPETYKPGRPCYSTTWADYTSEEAARMLDDLNDALTYNKDIDAATLESYKDNNYARAGYASAITLVKGLERLDASGLDLTWENFIKCMEQEPFDLGGFGKFSYANGVRLGITELALFEYYSYKNDKGEYVEEQRTTRGFETVEDIMKK